jgi:hypothetical protein
VGPCNAQEISCETRRLIAVQRYELALDSGISSDKAMNFVLIQKMAIANAPTISAHLLKKWRE